MKRNAVVKFLGLLICVAVSVSLAGCPKQGTQSTRVQTFAHGISPDDNPHTKQRIKEIDAEIAKKKANIEQYRDLRREWTYEQINLLKTMGTAGLPHHGSMDDGPRDFAHDYERLKNDIAAVGPGIEREKREIQDLMREKSQALNQGKNACFPGETLVLTGGGMLKPIEQVKPGDRVMTFDIGAQADIPKPVLDIYKSDNNHYYLINNAVKVTAFERFLTTDGWREVLQLKEGDKIHTSQGLETIRSLVVQYGPLEVHNLHVEGSHTFYVVGEDERLYLVHNSSGGGGGGSK